MSLAKNDDAAHSERRKTFERRARSVGFVPDAKHAAKDHSDNFQLVRAIHWSAGMTLCVGTKFFSIFRFRFANDMVYIGLSYYGPSLGQNQYLSFLLSSVVEVPSCLVCWLLMDRWGRRWPLCLAMTLSGISCIVTVTLPPGKLHRLKECI